MGRNIETVHFPDAAPKLKRVAAYARVRSILLLFVSRKPAIQGICPTRVFKILCIAGFF